MHTYHNLKPRESRVKENKPCHGYWSSSGASDYGNVLRNVERNWEPKATDPKREKGGGLVNWMELFGLSGFEDFEQVELTELKELERKHRGRVLRSGRRFMAAMLAAAMILPSAAMAAQLTYPPQVVRNPADGTSSSDPHIEIESNFVRDRFGFLTNTLELAIRVQSPTYDTGTVDGSTGAPIYAPRPVQSVSVNLAYNTEALHPVSWEWVKDDSATTPYDVETNVDNYYDAKLETQKDSRVQTAAAMTGIVDTTVHTGYTVTDNVANKKQGLLYFTARAFKAEPFEEMTTIAVIRFAVEDALMDHLEIVKDASGYKVKYDGTEINDIVTLQGAMQTTATAVGSTDPVLPLVDFAQQKDIEDADGKAASEGSTLLYYSDEFTQMNYIPDFDPATPVVESVTRPINGTDYTLDRPNTAQSPSHPAGDDWEQETLTLARLETPSATPGDPPTVDYSYTSNLIYKDNVKFTVVSKESFMAGNDDSNLTTIVYVDWDNTIMGTQIVPKRRDVRQLVSDHVAESFVHEDLRYPTATNVTSLKRTDSYRGRYPHTGPGGTGIITDGEKWPLTYKLDYTFFKREMVKPGKPDPNDPIYVGNTAQYDKDLKAWEESNVWEQVKDATTGNADTTNVVKYPFAYGWAECTLDNFMDVWTTMAAGASDDRGEFGDYTIDPITKAASVTYDGTEDFAFADLATGFTDDIVVLKAIYEPGDELERSNTNYSNILESKYYGQYGYVDSTTQGTAYVLRFQYERATPSAADPDKLTPDEYSRGVIRARTPAVQFVFTPMVEQTGAATGYVLGAPFYVRGAVDNTDVMEVEVTPASEIQSVGYMLMDEYGENYVTGLARSNADTNILKFYNNFDLDNFDYTNRVGTEGFTVEGVLRHLLETGVEAVKPNGSDAQLNDMVVNFGEDSVSGKGLLTDLNLKKNAAGDTFTGFTDPADAKTKLTALFAAAYANGGEDAVLGLDWHQLQYHLINASATDGSGGAIKSDGSIMSKADCIAGAPGTGGFDWCKLHGNENCAGNLGGTELDIDNWSQLLAAAHALGDATNSNPKAMNKLTPDKAHNTFSLAKDGDGNWSSNADIAALRMKIKDAVYDPAVTDYTQLTWGQVQYYIINGSFPTTLTDADTTAQDEYWWVRNSGDTADGKKGGENIDDLLAATDRATNASFKTPDGNIHNGWQANLKSITADMDKVTNAPLKLRASDPSDPDDGAAFADAGAFETAIKNLVGGVKATEPSWADNNNLGDWDTLQYNLIHYGTTSTYVTKATDPNLAVEAADYWWKYGTQVKDFATLMEAADATQPQGGASTAADPDGKLLSAVKADLLKDTSTDICLRKDEVGFPFETADMTTFVTNMKAIAASVKAAGKTMAADMTWDLLQYMLEKGITDYGTAVAAADVQSQVDDHYWWKDKGEGVTDVTTLLTAAQEAYGTDGTDGKKAKLSSVVYLGVPGNFAKDFKGTQYSSGTLTAGDTTAQTERQSFQTAMEGFADAYKTYNGGTMPADLSLTAQWLDVQYYIFHNVVDTNAARTEGRQSTAPAADGYYWWTPEAGSGSWQYVKRPVTVSTGEPTALGGPFDPNGSVAKKMMGDLLFRGYVNDTDATHNNSWNNFTDADVTNMRLIFGFAPGKTLADAAADADLNWGGTNPNEKKAALQAIMKTLAANVVPVDWKTSSNLEASNNLPSGYGYDAATKTVTLDWYVYQYAILNNGALPSATDYTDISTDGNPKNYWWLTKSDKGGVTETALDKFLNALEDCLQNNRPSIPATVLTNDIIEDVGLYIMNGTGATATYVKVTKASVPNCNNVRLKFNMVLNFLKNTTNPNNNPSNPTAMNIPANGYDPTNKQLNLTWYQLQALYIRPMNGPGGLMPPATASLNTPSADYTKVTGISAITPPSWAGDGTQQDWSKRVRPAVGSSLFSSAPVQMMSANAAALFTEPLSTEPELLDEYTETLPSDDEHTTITKTTREEYVAATDEYRTTETTTAVTQVPGGETTTVVTTTTTVTIITDSGGMLLDLTTTTGTTTQVIDNNAGGNY